LQQESIRTKDLRQQIALEIRAALDSLRSADEQVTAATEGLNLAEEELASARRRYEGGVSNSVEFTDAQNRLERARDNHISALFSFNLARIDLSVATGTIRQMLQ
jgi:outer membrane protein TolC